MTIGDTFDSHPDPVALGDRTDTAIEPGGWILLEGKHDRNEIQRSCHLIINRERHEEASTRERCRAKQSYADCCPLPAKVLSATMRAMGFRIIDREQRRVVAECETREEADQRLAELLGGDPSAAGVLFITGTGIDALEPQLRDEVERVRDTED